MSLLYALNKNNIVYIGVEMSNMIAGQFTFENCLSNYKLRILDNKVIIGIIGNKKEAQVILANKEIFTLDQNHQLTKKHLVLEVLPKIFNLLKDKELLIKRDDEPYYMNSTIVVAYQNKLYEIDSYFNVISYQRYLAVGKDSKWGLGVLTNNENMKPQNALLKALEISSKYVTALGKQYLLVNTHDLKYQLINGGKRC